MYPVNLVGCIRVNIPKTADTVKSDRFLMHGPCQLCRFYQGECWGEKVLTHTSLKQRIHFFSLRQELVCTRKGLDTHITYGPVLKAANALFSSSNRLQISALKMCVSECVCVAVCVCERERERGTDTHGLSICNPPTPPPPSRLHVCIGDSVCTLYVQSVSVCVCVSRQREVT